MAETVKNVNDLARLIFKERKTTSDDASKILGVDRKVIDEWSQSLLQKGYVTIEGQDSPNPALVPTEKLSEKVRVALKELEEKEKVEQVSSKEYYKVALILSFLLQILPFIIIVYLELKNSIHQDWFNLLGFASNLDLIISCFVGCYILVSLTGFYMGYKNYNVLLNFVVSKWILFTVFCIIFLFFQINRFSNGLAPQDRPYAGIGVFFMILEFGVGFLILTITSFVVDYISFTAGKTISKSWRR